MLTSRLLLMMFRSQKNRQNLGRKGGRRAGDENNFSTGGFLPGGEIGDSRWSQSVATIILKDSQAKEPRAGSALA
jgi:hypothetical protein